MFALLRTYSWQEFLHHPWRHAAAVLAITTGVALALAVHLINASALSEYTGAVSSLSGQPDVQLRALSGRMDERVLGWAAAQDEVAVVSPTLELSALARRTTHPSGDPAPVRLQVVGVDVLNIAHVAPGLLPRPQAGQAPMDLLQAGQVSLNAAARRQLGAEVIELQVGAEWARLKVTGSVAAQGAPLAVMDIAAAQALFGRQGQVTRIDLRLRPGADVAALSARTSVPPGVALSTPRDADERSSQMSRAYRVNLMALTLVALFTGAFLVYSVLALSVAQRAPQWALLGVLGLTGAQRLRLVIAESVALGAVGSVLGLGLGWGLAQTALHQLGGDLGGGFFAGMRPQLQWDPLAALGYGALGVLAAAAGGWWPARMAQALPLATSLKGLGQAASAPHAPWLPPVMAVAGVALALLPPIAGLPLGAYLGVLVLMLAGMTALPWVVGGLYERVAPALSRHALPMLAVERARRVRESAAVAVSGVVAALSLAVALTVMVASFRTSLMAWLDVVLPASLYVRTAVFSGGESALLPPALPRAVGAWPEVVRVEEQRVVALPLSSDRAPVALLARVLDDPAHRLQMLTEMRTAPAGALPIYVNEAMVDLYGAQLGQTLAALNDALQTRQLDRTRPVHTFVAGIWRDYARPQGAVALPRETYIAMTGDEQINDLAIWLREGAEDAAVQQRIRQWVDTAPGRTGLSSELLEFGTAAGLRKTSTRMFDRTFAVTYWLQGVVVAIGLFGVAASFSAQVLARRKEFGLLAHLGLTRRQILGVVAGEGLAWTLMGALAGLALGLAIAVVLVKVVNPQSFHWSMDLDLPVGRLAALCAAVVVSGTLTAWLAGRAAAGHDAVMAVKEDW